MRITFKLFYFFAEAVVAESVVVVKKLLQMEPSKHKDIIIHMAKLVDKITVPMARASILWLIGEYSERVPKIAPDVLRQMAKTFISEVILMKKIEISMKFCYCYIVKRWMSHTFWH